MNIYRRILAFMKKDLYTQGFNAMPAFFSAAGSSGFVTIKKLGYGYSQFAYNLRHGYGELYYVNFDFKRIWERVKNKIKKDPRYLEKVKRSYENTFARDLAFYSHIGKLNLKKVPDTELLIMLKRCVLAQGNSVGVGHIIESVSMELEKEFKKDLIGQIKDPKLLKKYFSQLTAPSKISFVAKEEIELSKILGAPKAQRRNLLELHARKYYWLQCSFLGLKYSNTDFFEKRLKKMKPIKQIRIPSKKILFKKLKLSKKIIDAIQIIDFVTVWQDERKKNMMISFANLGLVLGEVARRLKIDKKFIYCLNADLIMRQQSLDGISHALPELKKRYNGVIFLVEKTGETPVTGQQYFKLDRYIRSKNEKGKNPENEIHGSTANGGSIIGTTRICKGFSSLHKVKKGDVIVTSMTRPEFMPALKKAGAIITDEGGITCHAAIIARELNIPAVIGTRIATKLLKDGMTVEVKANHGVVKILNT